MESIVLLKAGQEVSLIVVVVVVVVVVVEQEERYTNLRVVPTHAVPFTPVVAEVVVDDLAVPPRQERVRRARHCTQTNTYAM